MLDLGSLGGTEGIPNALNNHSQVVGSSRIAGDETFHPFLWDKGSMKDLGTFGGSTGVGLSINDDGAVVGRANFPGDERWDAFLWRRGVMTDLGNLGCTSTALSINAAGQIVGTSRLADCQIQHAVLWENQTIYDLNDLVPADSGLELFETHSIEDDGVIAGNGLPPGCDDVHICGHAFLLFPCDVDRGACNDESLVLELGSNASLETLRIPQTEPSHAPRQNHTKRRQRGNTGGFSRGARDVEY